jgi:transcriptional regulator with XRE-family HTH domain
MHANGHYDAPHMAAETSPIRRRREALNLSLEGLAHQAGVSTATVYRAEHARHETSEETLAKLAKALGVGVSELRPPVNGAAR